MGLEEHIAGRSANIAPYFKPGDDHYRLPTVARSFSLTASSCNSRDRCRVCGHGDKRSHKMGRVICAPSDECRTYSFLPRMPRLRCFSHDLGRWVPAVRPDHSAFDAHVNGAHLKTYSRTSYSAWVVHAGQSWHGRTVDYHQSTSEGGAGGGCSESHTPLGSLPPR